MDRHHDLEAAHVGLQDLGDGDTAIGLQMVLEECDEHTRMIYTAAVLHDIGKSFQYKWTIPHEVAGEKIAKEILTTLPEDAQFTEEEQQQILRAIRGHRRKHEGMEPIEELFYDSDKRSRMCHSCPAQKQCNWTEEEKNMEIEI